MKPTPLNLLLNLARNPGKKTTAQLAAELGVAQQTASRWLAELKKEGMVEKTPSGLRLTQDAWNTLKQFQNPTPTKTEIFGIAVQGLGEGAYYLSLPGYRNQIKQKLGLDPYLGTLNLRLDSQTDLQNRDKLATLQSIQITGFKDEKTNRFYGGAKCYPCTANGIQAAIIIPDRTHHSPNILEIISPVHLRTKLKLKNGSNIKITV
ncbi:MAG: DUF120 domain-containing protein [Candidatus Micrarchaeota archaeon]